ncbi:MAG: agmatine deiminase family protein [Eggerthellaceae bacterium]|nr:agmatine deiminase family protein [Eggerthellaceae bacterium]
MERLCTIDRDMRLKKAERSENFNARALSDALITGGIPSDDGFRMPAEYSRHAGCIIIWPDRAGTWGNDPTRAQRAFLDVISKTAEHEFVYVAANDSSLESACAAMFAGAAKRSERPASFILDETAPLAATKDAWRRNIELIVTDTNDSWARDIGPVFLKDAIGKRKPRAVNFSFNAWGGKDFGSYAHWDEDDRFALEMCRHIGCPVYDASGFVLEGGSIASDGLGTIAVTQECLLNGGRNPGLSTESIEARLKRYLGAQKVLWLPFGLENDETNGHVDNVFAFTGPHEAVRAWTDDESDPNYRRMKANLDYLESELDATGERITVHKLPLPDHPICWEEKDLDGYTYESGEVMRKAGERLAAIYVNFYPANDSILLPVFGNGNSASDAHAAEILAGLFPERRITPVDSIEILKGGGNIHCITQPLY